MRQAISYSRVSHSIQVAKEFSLPLQEQKIREYAKYSELDLVKSFSDKGISGKRMGNRDGLSKAVQAVKECKGILIVYSLSRFGRNTVEVLSMIEELKKAGCGFVSLSENIDLQSSTGAFFLTILSALASFESAQLGERIRGKLNDLKKEGKKLGGLVRFGYTVDKERRLIPDSQEQKGLAIMVSGREAGETFQTIIDRLERAGIKPRKAAKWYPNTIRQIVNQQAV